MSFRRQFTEMKSATERDLSHVRADLSKVHRSMHSACLNLNANQRSKDTKSSVASDKVRVYYKFWGDIFMLQWTKKPSMVPYL